MPAGLFQRSTSISQMASETHLAARGRKSSKKTLVAGLREHGLGGPAVAFFPSGSALKPHHDRFPVLSGFR